MIFIQADFVYQSNQPLANLAQTQFRKAFRGYKKFPDQREVNLGEAWRSPERSGAYMLCYRQYPDSFIQESTFNTFKYRKFFIRF